MTNFTRSYFPTGSRLSTTWGRAVPIWLGPRYRLCADYASAQRGYFAVGGEVLALLLPYFYWAVSRTVKDFVADVKRR